jgi:AcrR family transcriptional regulator
MESQAATRPYRMSARADATSATGERILDATEELFWSGSAEGMTLAAVAERAGVTVQTVIRRYGSKDGLIKAAAERSLAGVREQRDEAPVGDVPGAVTNLLDHYEAVGHRALRLLAEEENPVFREFTEAGRTMHRGWAARTFAPQLEGLEGPERKRRLAQLIAVTDVYMWKLLRHDSKLSRPQVERAIVELIDGLEVN